MIRATGVRVLRRHCFSGADIVEVSPAYDSGHITGIAAADLAHELLSLVVVGKDSRSVAGQRRWHGEL